MTLCMTCCATCAMAGECTVQEPTYTGPPYNGTESCRTAMETAFGVWGLPTDGDLCGWPGIVCRSGRLVGLTARAIGQLPSNLAECTSLEGVDLFVFGSAIATLRDTRISRDYNNTAVAHEVSTMPPEWAAWSNLTSFRLSGLIRGTLPPQWAEWTKLESFHVGPEASSDEMVFDRWEDGVTGPLPPEYAAWIDLNYFNASRLHLTGTLPPNYASWTRLAIFEVKHCKFSGELPPAYSAWRNLRSLDVSSNMLVGALPPEYSALTSLQSFAADTNFFAGELPPAYAAWRQLSSFSVRWNALRGELPPAYGAWTVLKRFNVKENMLTGPFPTAYKSWTRLERFQASGNRFWSTLPPEYASWTSIDIFEVGHQEDTWGVTFSYAPISQYQYEPQQLPAEYASWTRIRLFRADNTGLQTALPPELGAWANIEDFTLRGSALTGSLPPEYGAWTKIRSFYATPYYPNTGLKGSIPASYANWSNIREFSVANSHVGDNLRGGVVVPKAPICRQGHLTVFSEGRILASWDRWHPGLVSGVGFTCIPCRYGTFYTELAGGTRACVPCGLSTYGDRTGLVGPDECKLCPAGTFGTRPGLTSAVDCTPCEVGSFRAATRVEVCEACPVGMITAGVGAASAEACICGQGSYAEGGSCVLCGFLSTTSGQGHRSADDCTMSSYGIIVLGCSVAAAVLVPMLLVGALLKRRLSQARQEVKAMLELCMDFVIRVDAQGNVLGGSGKQDFCAKFGKAGTATLLADRTSAVELGRIRAFLASTVRLRLPQKIQATLRAAHDIDVECNLFGVCSSAGSTLVGVQVR